ncbi:MAG: MarR family transcriptional regulator [Pseudomonas sp.]
MLEAMITIHRACVAARKYTVNGYYKYDFLYHVNNRKLTWEPHTMSSKEPTFVTGFLIHDVSRLRKKVMDRAVKHLGITRSQYWVLINIARYGREGIAQTKLANLMNVGKVSLGGLIDRMEISGVLERLPDPEDRRAKKVFMTPKGEDLLHVLQDIGMEINHKSIKGISKEQNKLLDGMLKIMKHNLVQQDKEGG